MFETFKLYAILGLVALALAGAGYVMWLRHTVSTQAAQIVQLQATEQGLRAGIAILEEVNRHRTVTLEQLGSVKQEVERAPEAPVPDAIGRALDGLRQLQARPRNP